MRKTALTAYGLVGTDWIRMTAAVLESGATVFVRADGSNAILPMLPTTFRTSGDIVNVVASLGHRVNLASVPSVALPNHAWKGTFDLDGIANHFATQHIVPSLKASYTIVDRKAA